MGKAALVSVGLVGALVGGAVVAGLYETGKFSKEVTPATTGIAYCSGEVKDAPVVTQKAGDLYNPKTVIEVAKTVFGATVSVSDVECIDRSTGNLVITSTGKEIGVRATALATQHGTASVTAYKKEVGTTPIPVDKLQSCLDNESGKAEGNHPADFIGTGEHRLDNPTTLVDIANGFRDSEAAPLELRDVVCLDNGIYSVLTKRGVGIVKAVEALK